MFLRIYAEIQKALFIPLIRRLTKLYLRLEKKLNTHEFIYRRTSLERNATGYDS